MSSKRAIFPISKVNAELEDTDIPQEKINAIVAFCRLHFSSLRQEVYELIEKGIQLAEYNAQYDALDTLLIYRAYYLLHYEQRTEAYRLCKELLPKFLADKNFSEYGFALTLLCQMEWSKGNLEAAFEYIKNALISLKYKRNKLQSLAYIYYIQAVFYFDLNELTLAKQFYQKSLNYLKKVAPIGLLGYIKIGLASISVQKEEYFKGVRNLEEVLKIGKEYFHWNMEARAYHELGKIYLLNKQPQKARIYFLKSYDIRKSNHALPALVSTMISLAEICFEQKQYEACENYLKEALEICVSKRLNTKTAKIYQLFSQLYEHKNAFQASLVYLKKYNLLSLKQKNDKVAIKNKYLKFNYQSEHNKKLNKTSRYLNVINEFAVGFLKTNTIDEIVWMVARDAIGKLGYEDCVVYLFDENKEYLLQKAAWGPKNPISFDIHKPIKLKPGLGIVGDVARTGIGEIVSDTSKDERYFLDDESRLSEITVPIIADGLVIGIIDSEHTKRNFYSQEDLRTLTTIASMTSSRLTQAFVLEKLKRHQLKLEENVRDKTRELHKALNHLQVMNTELSYRNDEKDILLKEVHHRVKNNLQIVTSLLSLQSFSIKDSKTKALFDTSQHRINAMALIHEMLYQSDNLSMINYAEYLQFLLNNLLKSFKGVQHNISLQLSVVEMYLNIDTAIPLGLMINEIVTNSLKYAFNDSKEGLLSLKISETDQTGRYFMEIGDNGPGFSDSFDRVKRKSLGMQLIFKLTKQINGQVDLDYTRQGTHYKIYFENI